MHIRTTTDPITLHDISDIEDHPYLFEWDGVNGIEIYFENQETRRIYMELESVDKKIVTGSDTDDYVAEG